MVTYLAKPYKIKRTKGSIYQKNRSKAHSPLSILGIVLLILGLVAVGWFVYPPVYDMITGNNAPRNSGLEQNVSSAPSSEPEEPPAKSEAENATPTSASAIRAVYAPTEVILDTARLEALLQQASAAGYNTVLFDVKDGSGTVLYNSQNATALQCAAISASPFDLNATVELVTSYQLRPAARIYTMRDPLSSRIRRDMAVKYENEDGMLWLDDYADQGGNSWLNPNSASAQDYNIELVQECLGSGVKLIIASGVQFPTARGGLDKAGYGDVGNKTKADILSGFIARLDSAVSALGGQLAVESPIPALLAPDSYDYLGNPAAYPLLAVNAMPAIWGTSSQLLDAVNPVQDPYGTVLSTLRTAKGNTQARLIAYVQAYTDNAAAASGKQYGKAEVSAQLDALHELNIEEYILYSPDGNYPI